MANELMNTFDSGTDLVTRANFNVRIEQGNTNFADLENIVSSKAGKSTVVAKTLSAASWTGSAAPYSYSLTVTGVTTTSAQEVLETTDITQVQLTALLGAIIKDGGQSANTMVLKAWGTKPTIDLPIRVILRGDI